MQVQINTDRNIEGNAALASRAEAIVASALRRFVDQVTRVEVHLSDENGGKGGDDDKRCLMEVRLEGRKPTAVSYRAATVEAAMDGAAGKLARAIENTLGRLRSTS
jgi:ribosome-associated translation inhibitor RaiA